MDSQKLRDGSNIIVNGAPCRVVKYQHVMKSRGSGKMNCKVKNLLTGAVIEKVWDSGKNVEEADIAMGQAQFLYANGNTYTFMDNKSYEQFEFDKDQLGETVKYLTEGLEVSVMNWNGNPINIDLPPIVELKVIETEPGVRGDTVSGGTKPAKLETGLVVQVPFFVNAEDVLVINTVTGEYKERAKS